MKTVEAQGYSKEKALEATGLEVEMEQLKNATIAWKKAGFINIYKKTLPQQG